MLKLISPGGLHWWQFLSDVLLYVFTGVILISIKAFVLENYLVSDIPMYNIVIRTTALWWYDDKADTTWWTSLMTVPVWRVCFNWCNTWCKSWHLSETENCISAKYTHVQYWNKNDNSVMIRWRGWYHLVDFTDDSSCLTCMFLLV